MQVGSYWWIGVSKRQGRIMKSGSRFCCRPRLFPRGIEQGDREPDGGAKDRDQTEQDQPARQATRRRELEQDR